MDPLDGGHPVDPRQPHVHEDDLRLEPGDGVDRVLSGLDHTDEFEVVEVAEEELKALLDDRVVVDHETFRVGHVARILPSGVRVKVTGFSRAPYSPALKRPRLERR